MKPKLLLALVVARTSASGKVTFKAPRRPGRYYVSVTSSYVPGQAECGAAKSASVKVRR